MNDQSWRDEAINKAYHDLMDQEILKNQLYCGKMNVFRSDNSPHISKHWCACLSFYASTLVAAEKENITELEWNTFQHSLVVRMMCQDESNPLASEFLAYEQMAIIEDALDNCKKRQSSYYYEPVVLQLGAYYRVSNDKEACEALAGLLLADSKIAREKIIPAIKSLSLDE